MFTVSTVVHGNVDVLMFSPMLLFLFILVVLDSRIESIHVDWTLPDIHGIDGHDDRFGTVAFVVCRTRTRIW